LATLVVTGLYAFNFGGSDVQVAIPTGTGFRITALLSGDGATNAQIGLLSALCNSQKTADNATLSVHPVVGAGTGAGRGTAAEDSTAAKTLAVTAQWSVALAAYAVALHHAVLVQE
jgi:hypothetical protein